MHPSEFDNASLLFNEMVSQLSDKQLVILSHIQFNISRTKGWIGIEVGRDIIRPQRRSRTDGS